MACHHERHPRGTRTIQRAGRMIPQQSEIVHHSFETELPRRPFRTGRDDAHLCAQTLFHDPQRLAQQLETVAGMRRAGVAEQR